MHRSLSLLLALALLVLPASLTAQANPGVEASNLIRDLTRRSTMPPIEAQARLETISAEVARELGRQIMASDLDTARRVTAYLAESNSSRAHAALLYSLTLQDEERRDLCLNMLVQLEFYQVNALGKAASELSPTLLQRVRDAGFQELALGMLKDIVKNSSGYGYRTASYYYDSDSQASNANVQRARQYGLALLTDVMQPGSGFRLLVNQLLEMMVGEDTADFLVEAQKRMELERNLSSMVESDEHKGKKPEELLKLIQEDSTHEQHEAFKNYTPLSDEEREKHKRYVEIESLRNGAQTVFSRLMMLDPDRGGRTLGRYAYIERKTCADGFWNEYERAFGPVGSWIDHLEYLRKPNEYAEGASWTVLLLMDELCGGVKVIPTPPAPKPGEESGEPATDVGPPTPVAIFDGSNPSDKILKFKSLTTPEQRERLKALRTEFAKHYLPKGAKTASDEVQPESSESKPSENPAPAEGDAPGGDPVAPPTE